MNMRTLGMIVVCFIVSGRSVSETYGLTTWPPYTYPGFSKKSIGTLAKKQLIVDGD